MANFCKSCSIELFGKDFEELKPKEPAEPGYYYSGICETCGMIQVDNDGDCVSEDCNRQRNPDACSQGLHPGRPIFKETSP